MNTREDFFLKEKPTEADLESLWMPFTANTEFKKDPRLVVAATDMHYQTANGRKVLDGVAGLWCVNAGHCRPKIVEAIQKQAATLDYASLFKLGHPAAFKAASHSYKTVGKKERQAELWPELKAEVERRRA